MRSLLVATTPAALLGLCALSPAAVAADNVEIRLVDGRERPVTGLDVFVYGHDGASLTAALGAGESIFADGAGSMLTVELPGLRSAIDVDLPERGDAVVTLTVSRDKGLTGAVFRQVDRPHASSAVLRPRSLERRLRERHSDRGR